MVRSRRLFRLRFLLLAGVLTASYVGYALMQPLEALTPQTAFRFNSPVSSPVSLPWPSVGEGALSAVGYGQLSSYGAQVPRPTASVIKLLTALVVLDQKPLSLNMGGSPITLTQDDIDSYNHYVALDGSVVRVALSEQISEYQALQALLLPSANNIAETLARWSYGSINNFNNAAMHYASQLGMSNTIVTDPSGFLASTVSTPSDLLKLGETALQNPVVAQIVAQTSAVIPVQGEIHNVNFALGAAGIMGLKTGNSTDNPGAFLFAAHQVISGQTLTIIGVIMDAPSLYVAINTAPAVVRAAVQNFIPVIIAHASQPLAHYDSPWGDMTNAVPLQDISLLMWRGSTPNVSVQTSSFTPPYARGVPAGSLIVRLTPAAPGQSYSLVLDRSFSAPSPLWRLVHPH